MSVAECNSESETNSNPSWNTLISDAESQISELQDRVVALRKSIVYFGKQRDAGIPLPKLRPQTQDLS